MKWWPNPIRKNNQKNRPTEKIRPTKKNSPKLPVAHFFLSKVAAIDFFVSKSGAKKYFFFALAPEVMNQFDASQLLLSCLCLAIMRMFIRSRFRTQDMGAEVNRMTNPPTREARTWENCPWAWFKLELFSSSLLKGRYFSPAARN